jgi:hypothetical protein
MKLKIEIDMDGAAFEESGQELRRILRDLGDRLEEFQPADFDYCRDRQEGHVRHINDVNGNRVGFARVEE